MGTTVFLEIVNKPTATTLSQAVANMLTKQKVLSFAAIVPVNGLNEAVVWGYSD